MCIWNMYRHLKHVFENVFWNMYLIMCLQVEKPTWKYLEHYQIWNILKLEHVGLYEAFCISKPCIWNGYLKQVFGTCKVTFYVITKILILLKKWMTWLHAAHVSSSHTTWNCEGPQGDNMTKIRLGPQKNSIPLQPPLTILHLMKGFLRRLNIPWI